MSSPSHFCAGEADPAPKIDFAILHRTETSYSYVETTHVSIYSLCFFLLCRPLDSCCVLCYFSHSSALRVYAGFGLVVRSLCLAYADVVPALLAQGLLVALAPAFATSSTAPLRARRPVSISPEGSA